MVATFCNFYINFHIVFKLYYYDHDSFVTVLMKFQKVSYKSPNYIRKRFL